jgi:hypothetical protein
MIATTTTKWLPVKRTPEPCPPPGIYRDIPFDEYVSWDALNASTIGKFLESGRAGAHYLNSESSPPTKDMLFGSALHSAMLEPVDYAKRMHIDEKIGPTAEVTHRKVAEQHPDSIILRKGWNEQIVSMARSISSHKAARYLLREVEGSNELTIVWDITRNVGGEQITVRCKARIDRHIPEFYPNPDASEPVSCFLDLKTCAAGKGSPEQFERTIANWGYHRQAAWYLSGGIQLGMIDKMHANSYIVLAVEKSAPYPVGTYPICCAALEQGWNECKQGMAAYLKYRLHGHAPHACENLVPVSIPNWATSPENEESTND